MIEDNKNLRPACDNLKDVDEEWLSVWEMLILRMLKKTIPKH